MRRWNGWGDDTITYPLHASALRFLEQRVGPGAPPKDAAFAAVVAQVPPARLPTHSLVSSDSAGRLRHARGQSLPDWVALRSGRIAAFPDGVAHPTSDADVRELIRYAQAIGGQLIPYGGGTSVVGHINVGQSARLSYSSPGPLSDRAGPVPILTVDLSRLNGLRRFDATSGLATFGAGVTGPNLEAQLRAAGFTLGHFPQSFEYSTLGGWIATRSCGQQSFGYGRIERLFAGGHVETPAGALDLPSFPASAAGPDLRELVLGSEGRLGIITEATVRVTRLPEHEEFRAVFFPTWEQAQTAARAIVQARLPLSMLRVSTAAETEITLALAGHDSLIAALESLLKMRGIGDGKCLALLGFTGREGMVKATRHEALGIMADHRGVHVGETFGKQWHASRFRTPYLRNTLWDLGYAIDTLETATDWANVPFIVDAIEAALHTALAETGERVHVFTHLSHLYPDGSSIYTTYLFRLAPDPDETLARWQAMKAAASAAIVARGGTISHQHGVGVDHAPYLAAEKGALGLSAIREVCAVFEPGGMMNPGKLVE